MISFLLSLFLLQSPLYSDNGTEQPNIIVFMIDDVGTYDVDNVHTPNIDWLSSQGLKFNRFYSFPVCSTTRYATMFGQYSRRDNIGKGIGSYVPPSADVPMPSTDLVSLADLVHQRGYRAGMFGKWHLGTTKVCTNLDLGINECASTPILHGFDDALAVSMANLQGPDGLYDYFHWFSTDNGVFSESDIYVETERFNKFQDWWLTYPGPKFAYYAVNLAHGPYHVPFNPAPSFLLPRTKYERMVRAADQILGQVLSLVDLNNTYIFFLSDNGTPNEMEIQPCPPGVSDCAKHTVYEPGIKVPALVFGPGIVPNETDALVSCVDIMATIADILDVKNPGRDSISFAPMFGNQRYHSRRYAFSEIFDTQESERAVIGSRYKLRVINDTQEFFYDLELGEMPTVLDIEIQKSLRDVLNNPLDVALQEF